MTLNLANNPMSTKIHEIFFFNPLSTENKEYRERSKINFNNEQPNLESLSHTAIRQSNVFSIPAVVGIAPNPPLPKYYNYSDKDKSFVVRYLFVEQSNESIISAKNDILLRNMLSEIESLLENEYDWDEIDYRKPTPEDINRSKEVLTEFVSIIDSEGYSLKKPHISNFEEGGASIKWKIGDRTLYLEIGQNVSIFSKVWRESDETRVIERPLFKTDYLELWKWIINERL